LRDTQETSGISTIGDSRASYKPHARDANAVVPPCQWYFSDIRGKVILQLGASKFGGARGVELFGALILRKLLILRNVKIEKNCRNAEPRDTAGTRNPLSEMISG